MLRRFIKIKDLITSTLTLTNASLPDEWEIAIEIVDIIDPFEEVTTLYLLIMYVFLIFNSELCVILILTVKINCM